jgi:iron(III) transport system substrate-binding protein
MMKLTTAITAGLLWALTMLPASAQEPPALSSAKDPAEKARVAELIEAAKKEGAVSFWDTVIQPETNDLLTAAFKAHYGLPASFQVNYTLSATGPLVTRIEQEISAKRFSIDVAAIASPTWVFERAAAGDILEYASPEYANYNIVFDSGLGLKNFFAFNGAYYFAPMWSTEHLKFEGKSWKDVLKAVPANRMSVGDASKSVAYLATHIGLRTIMEPDYFKSLAEAKPSLLVRSEQVAARLVSGEDLMAFSGMPTRAYQYNQKGGKLKVMMPEEGVVLMPQCTFILKGAAHPASAKLLIDFLLSETGQSIIAKGEAMISGRTSFKSPNPEYSPSIDTMKLIKVDWKSLNTDKLKAARAEWTGIYNP